MKLLVVFDKVRRKRESACLSARVKQGGQLGSNMLSGRRITKLETAKQHCRKLLPPGVEIEWDESGAYGLVITDKTVLLPRCSHGRLDEYGICRSCGLDCRGIHS
jgi:hypothetical protein